MPGGDAETRDNPVYLVLIPGYREETLKPGIIPGNPVYLAGMGWGMLLHLLGTVWCSTARYGTECMSEKSVWMFLRPYCAKPYHTVDAE